MSGSGILFNRIAAALSLVGLVADLVGVLIIRHGTKLGHWAKHDLDHIGTSFHLEQIDETFRSWTTALRHLANAVKDTNRLTARGTWWLVAGFILQFLAVAIVLAL